MVYQNFLNRALGGKKNHVWICIHGLPSLGAHEKDILDIVQVSERAGADYNKEGSDDR